MKTSVDTEEKRYKGYALKHSFLGILTAFSLKLSSVFSIIIFPQIFCLIILGISTFEKYF